jgi:hypothetical protein
VRRWRRVDRLIGHDHFHGWGVLVSISTLIFGAGPRVYITIKALGLCRHHYLRAVELVGAVELVDAINDRR